MAMNPLEFLRNQDELLRDIIDYVAKIENLEPPLIQVEDYEGKNDFPALVRSIVGQQISTSGAKAIYSRLLSLMPNEIISAQNILSFSIEELKSCGLSYGKSSYIYQIAEEVENGNLDFKLLHQISEEDARTKLESLKGVGKWTADIFLMFQLNKPDVFPIGDAGVKSAIKKMYQLPKDTDDQVLIDIAEKWRPHRSLATKYLWRALDNNYFKNN
tara:strand:- start:144 stop:788 length:645 start_codon:yes stop_codon:yes gene_type:complete